MFPDKFKLVKVVLFLSRESSLRKPAEPISLFERSNDLSVCLLFYLCANLRY